MQAAGSVVFVFLLIIVFLAHQIRISTVVCLGHSLFSFHKKYYICSIKFSVRTIIRAYGIVFHVNDLIVCEHK